MSVDIVASERPGNCLGQGLLTASDVIFRARNYPAQVPLQQRTSKDSLQCRVQSGLTP